MTRHTRRRPQQGTGRRTRSTKRSKKSINLTPAYISATIAILFLIFHANRPVDILDIDKEDPQPRHDLQAKNIPQNREAHVVKPVNTVTPTDNTDTIAIKTKGATKKRAQKKRTSTKTHTLHKNMFMKKISWTFPSPMPAYAELTATATVPCDKDGVALASAHTTVLVFPYPTEKQALKGGARILAEKHGLSLLNIYFSPVNRRDPKLNYYLPESHSDEAWITALTELRRKFTLPKRKIIAFGLSGGASSAHQFTEAHPDMVAACALVSAFYFVDTPRYTGPQLVLYGEGDITEENTLVFLDSLLAQNPKVPRPLVVPFHCNSNLRARGSHNRCHCMPGAEKKFCFSWIADVAENIDDNGDFAAMTDWPIQMPQILPGKKSLAALNKTPPPSELLAPDIWLVKPTGKPRSLIILLSEIDNNKEVETLLDAHHFADDGHLCLAISDAGLSNFSSHAKKCIRDAQEANIPISIVSYNPSMQSCINILALNNGAAPVQANVFLVHASIQAISEMSANDKNNNNSIGGFTHCIHSQGVAAILKPKLKDDIQWIQSPASTGQPGAWRVALTSTLLQHINYFKKIRNS